MTDLKSFEGNCNMTKKLCVIVVSVLFLILIAPYIYVECNTFMHGKETRDLYKQTDITSDNNYQKVFQYSDKKCKVLYADENVIYMCVFNKNGKDEWTLESWNAVRSKQGSADGFIYPYYGYLHKK